MSRKLEEREVVSASGSDGWRANLGGGHGRRHLSGVAGRGVGSAGDADGLTADHAWIAVIDLNIALSIDLRVAGVGAIAKGRADGALLDDLGGGGSELVLGHSALAIRDAPLVGGLGLSGRGRAIRAGSRAGGHGGASEEKEDLGSHGAEV